MLKVFVYHAIDLDFIDLVAVNVQRICPNITGPAVVAARGSLIGTVISSEVLKSIMRVIEDILDHLQRIAVDGRFREPRQYHLIHAIAIHITHGDGGGHRIVGRSTDIAGNAPGLQHCKIMVLIIVDGEVGAAGTRR